MREMGQEDAVYRNYDVSDLNGSKPGIALDRAFERMGFDQKHTARAFVLPTVAQRLRNVGYVPPADLEVLAARMREWYQWDRIRAGELRSFPRRPVAFNPLI